MLKKKSHNPVRVPWREQTDHVSCHAVSQSCLTPCDPMDCTRQAPLSVGFSRQECWSGLSCLPPLDLPDRGTEPKSPASPALAGEFFTAEPPRKPEVVPKSSALFHRRGPQPFLATDRFHRRQFSYKGWEAGMVLVLPTTHLQLCGQAPNRPVGDPCSRGRWFDIVSNSGAIENKTASVAFPSSLQFFLGCLWKKQENTQSVERWKAAARCRSTGYRAKWQGRAGMEKQQSKSKGTSSWITECRNNIPKHTGMFSEGITVLLPSTDTGVHEGESREKHP